MSISRNDKKEITVGCDVCPLTIKTDGKTIDEAREELKKRGTRWFVGEYNFIGDRCPDHNPPD